MAHFTGNHDQDALAVRLGWSLTRLVQKGPYGIVTHCEAILGGNCDSAVIASSSVRDGGVRVKHGVRMDPAAWLIVDAPQWDAMRSAHWFAEHDGEPYDWRGAWATVMPGHPSTGWFCNESVAASAGVVTPECFTPSQFCALCLTFGRDVTHTFFNT